jgi:type I restriction enzyme R subunit
MSNFTFLKIDWPELYETAREAEQNVNSAPRTSCFYSRRSLERAVKWLFANDSYLKQPYADNLPALIHEPTFRENLEPGVQWGQGFSGGFSGVRLDLLTFF